MTTPPETLRELLEFINNNTNALTTQPGLDELADFSNGCTDKFVGTYGDGTDIIPTPNLMRSLLHLSPISNMQHVNASLVNLERRHRILFASEFSCALIGHNSQNVSMRISPLEDIVNCTYKYSHDPSSTPFYTQRIPDEHRPFIVAATIREYKNVFVVKLFARTS